MLISSIHAKKMRERQRQAEAEGVGSSTLNVLLSNVLICLSSSHFLTVQPLQDRTKKRRIRRSKKRTESAKSGHRLEEEEAEKRKCKNPRRVGRSNKRRQTKGGRVFAKGLGMNQRKGGTAERQ